ncbi:MAG: helix-turn-helix transcriptional regulator [Candidatus Blackburnbacteria bacterium]|nr:helix-turn-helix transcriptional regulator [Candidatus Blackburnbacteria bacterium]
MPRLIFPLNTQVEFFKSIRESSGLSANELAGFCKVSPRTIRDWSRAKFTPSELAVLFLSKKFSVELPIGVKVVDDFWYGLKGSRKGALRRMELYGPPGTPEGRHKGGIISQLKRKQNPKKYRLLNCNLRKKFNLRKSAELAEAIGIILGDGCITANQVRITVSKSVDYLFAKNIQSLFLKVFGEKPSWHTYPRTNVILLTISGTNLVKKLKSIGLVQGNKVRQQVEIPDWIWLKTEFQKACIRGLMDTDGGCYFHTHQTNGLLYKNFGLCFTNHSFPLVEGVYKMLKSLDLKCYFGRQGKAVYIYDFNHIQRYFSLIGSSNPKNLDKLEHYSKLSTHRLAIR